MVANTLAFVGIVVPMTVVFVKMLAIVELDVVVAPMIDLVVVLLALAKHHVEKSAHKSAHFRLDYSIFLVLTASEDLELVTTSKMDYKFGVVVNSANSHCYKTKHYYCCSLVSLGANYCCHFVKVVDVDLPRESELANQLYLTADYSSTGVQVQAMVHHFGHW